MTKDESFSHLQRVLPSMENRFVQNQFPYPLHNNSDSENPQWLHYLESCLSTNTWAIERAARLQHGDVVFTRRQTAGRGQHGRTWHAPPGALTASFVLDRLPAAKLSGLSLAAGLATIYAIEDLLPDLQGQLQVKWPNDILVHERKLAGILCEAVPSRSCSFIRVVVGIGLNRCIDFEQSRLDSRSVGNAVSLHQVSSSVPNELSLLERLRHYLMQTAGLFARTDTLEEKSGLSALLPELRRRDVLLDRQVRVELSEEIIIGQGSGIDSLGQLLLRMPDDQIRAFMSGRVRWN
jgi:BirA family biotin operon repressor/biotin-[acetyl-CoA-carboxylase] ligase